MPERVLASLGVTLEQMRAAALGLIPGASVFVFDRDLRVRMADGGALRERGYDPEALSGTLLEDAIPRSAFLRHEPEYRATLEGECREFMHQSEDGQAWYSVHTKPIRDDGEVIGGVVFSVDVTDFQEARSQLARANIRFETSFDKAPIGMALVGLDGTWLRVNPALSRITGYSEEELKGVTFADITHPDDLGEDQRNAQRLLDGEQESYTMEKRYIRKNGDLVWVELNGSLVRDQEGEPLHFIAQVQDVSNRKSLEEQLRRRAFEDPLTGLPNRRFFEDQLNRQFDRCRRHGEEAAVFMVDIDAFKDVNDRNGHATGDDLLRFFAENLLANARTHDVVSRLGGDEFALLKTLVHPGDAANVAARMEKNLDSLKMKSGTGFIGCRASVGWAPLNDRTESVDSAMNEADHSMYEAKRRRRVRR